MDLVLSPTIDFDITGRQCLTLQWPMGDRCYHLQEYDHHENDALRSTIEYDYCGVWQDNYNDIKINRAPLVVQLHLSDPTSQS
jgi:hypothetical protein